MRRQAQFLSDQGNPVLLSCLGMAEVVSLVIDPNGSLIGTVDSCQDFDQCAFTRAIFSTNGSNLARVNRKEDLVKRIDGAKALGEVLYGQDRCLRWRVPAWRTAAHVFLVCTGLGVAIDVGLGNDVGF